MEPFPNGIQGLLTDRPLLVMQLVASPREGAERGLAPPGLSQLLAAVKWNDRVVLAVGGSVVDDARNFARLRETCRTIWLTATAEEHFQRVVDQGDSRPMQGRPRAFAELEALLERRSRSYGLCDAEVSTSRRSREDVSESVLSLLASD